MEFLEIMNEVANVSVIEAMMRLSESGKIPADEAVIMLAGNAVRIVTLMRGEEFARKTFEAAIADAVKIKKSREESKKA